MATAPRPGSAEASVAPPTAVADRVCGRCRRSFVGDPDAHPTAQPGWWACASCRAALLDPVVTRG